MVGLPTPAAIVACSSTNNDSGGGGGTNGTGQDGSTSNATSCTNPTVTIDFSPMYSAFVTDSTAQQFLIPAVTDDGSQATWTISDTTVASLQAQTIAGQPGVMITMSGVGSGSVTVTATESNGTCGVSTLNITSAVEDDWTIGSQRYNDGIALHIGPPPGFDGGLDGGGGGGRHRDGGGGDGGGPPFRNDGGSFFEVDGGTACTNCHGPTATNGPYNDVSHTPEQIGGFSDDDLIGIITEGVVPDGGYFDPTVITPSCDAAPECTARAYNEWHQFHQWTDITSDQYKGIVVYLRSLTPAPQNGTSNFGGRGGGHRPDGG